MNYTIYLQSGQILRVVITDDINSQLNNNEQYLIGQYDDDKYYVENGIAVLMPSRPNEYCVFDYTTKLWLDPRTDETQWPIIRIERNNRLLASDWTQLADISQETKTLWEPYRQALRDITNQPDPFNIVWPTKPE